MLGGVKVENLIGYNSGMGGVREVGVGALLFLRKGLKSILGVLTWDASFIPNSTSGGVSKTLKKISSLGSEGTMFQNLSDVIEGGVGYIVVATIFQVISI